MRKLKSELLTSNATLRVCKESELSYKYQVRAATKGEVIWMSLFMVALVVDIILSSVIV